MAARDQFGNVLLMPPNGFAGAAQQSAAVRHHLSSVTGGSHVSRTKGHTKSVKRPRKKAAGTVASGSRRTKSSSKKAVGMTILKAGSAAALAWGKKMAAAKKKKKAAAGG